MRFDQPVLIYGAGREARSTRAFLAEQAPGLKIYVTVDSGEADIPATEFLPAEQLPQALADQRFGLIVKSPGVSLYKPIFDQARRAGIPVTSNLNLWGAFFAAGRTVVAITGTKGKSTTATLLHAMLVEADLDAGLAGNVGVPPLDAGAEHQIVVFELSSYQTADMDFAPDIVGITALYPEHIDWHGTTARYFADKLRLLDLNPAAKLALGPQAATHPALQPHLRDPSRLLPGLDAAFEDQIFETAASSRLKGQHNLDNAILAARIALFLGAGEPHILAAIKAFTPLPHRLAEHLIAGLTFVDDSISTTPEATAAALAAYHGRTIALIAGGFDRQQDYEDLARQIGAADVPVLVCLPETGRRLAAAVARHAPATSIIEAASLADGMRALELRRAHFDTVILSPGAPSYNQFANFAERGDKFVALANQLFAG